jgi:hypothetical protein
MEQRKIALLVGAAALTATLAVGTLGTGFAQGVPQPGFVPGGMMGGAGSSMTHGSGPGGMMDGQGYGPGMMSGWSDAKPGQPITSLDGAKQGFQRYVDTAGDTNLTLDEVIQFQWNYYAIVKDTSTGLGAIELLANPQTGAVVPEMGPNMMWRTQNGHMAGIGMMGAQQEQPVVQPAIAADQAQQIAQQWLDQSQPGSATQTADTFPGYYTLHFTRDGQLAGMLSVNATTGAVWYHTWHGGFVASTET